MAKTAYNINGSVISNQSKIGIRGLKIEAWDKDLIFDDMVGGAVTDSDGNFSMSFTKKYFGEIFLDRKPDLYFKIFDGDQLLYSSEKDVLWNIDNGPAAVVFNINYDVNTNGGGSGTELIVSGNIVTDAGVAVAHVKVQAYDVNLTGNNRLGETNSNEIGAYAISYYKPALKGKMQADIEVQVFDANTLLGKSQIKYHAGAIEKIDVTLAAANVSKLPEYGQLITDIQAHLGTVALKDLEENEQVQQISLVANKSGWDARALAMAVLANKLSAQTGIEAAHYYALFRSGIAGNADTINKLPAETISAAINAAIKNNIIAQDDKLDDTIQKHNAESATFLLNQTAGVSSLNSMLSLRLNDSQKKIFIDAVQQTGNDSDQFWSQLKAKGIDDATVQKLQIDGKLGFLTALNAPLVNKLYSELKIDNTIDLVAKGLYNASEWKRIIGNDTPENVDADIYANHLANQVNLAYPNAVLADMLNHGQLVLAAQQNQINGTTVNGVGSIAPSGTNEAAAFLMSKQDIYDIGIRPVKTWEGFDQLSSDTKTTLKSVERIYQLSPSNDAMVALSKTGLSSAYEITSYSRDEFLVSYEKDFKSTDEANLIYTKAHEISGSVLNVATNYLNTRSMPNIYSITGKTEKKPSEVIAYPTLEELFGNMDYCACDHCKSVLSPAAYLVDLLQFIDLKNVPHELENPIDELLHRRPDLQYIELSCENTNTAMPYIDLVNETLEYYVVNGSLTDFKGRDIEEGTTTQDLLANPQFVNQDAYQKMRQEVYPYNLPFDQPLEALRLFYKAWGISLEDAYGIFQTPLLMRRERLGLNTEEYLILTDSSFHKLPEYFGEDAATTMDDLNIKISNGKEFSRRVNISYEELVQLLGTNFINPGFSLVPALQKLKINLQDLKSFYDGTLTGDDLDAMIPPDIDPANYNGDIKQWLRDNEQLIMKLVTLTDVGSASSECNFADVQLRYALPDNTLNQLDELAYQKLLRFIRIWKKIGWTIETTDSVITTVLPVLSQSIDMGNLDAVFVTLLARLSNFRQALSDLSFSERKIPMLLSIWDNSKDLVFRQTQIAQLLKISLEDMGTLQAMTGIDPLTMDLEQDQPSLTSFIDIIRALKNISLKIKDLSYLLRHIDESGKLTPTDQFLLKSIKALHDNLNAVEKDNSIAPDNADFSFAKSKMALVYDAGVTEEFFAFLTNGQTYSAVIDLQTEEGLPVKLLNADPDLQYDPFTKMLGYKGILSTNAEDALKTVADALVLADVVNINTQANLDILIAEFKSKLHLIAVDGANDLNAFFLVYPELDPIYGDVMAQPTPEMQISALLSGMLPELKTRLKSMIVRQSLASIIKTDPEIVDVLTAGNDIVHAATDAAKPVLDDFLSLEEEIIFNNNQAYSFYVDAPSTDDFLIYASAEAGTVITLSVDGTKIIDAASIGVSGEVFNNVDLHLTGGNLYLFELTISNLPATKTVSLSWRTRGMAKSLVPDSNITGSQQAANAKTSVVRLQKAAQLRQVLKLTAIELQYFAAQNAGTKNILNELITTLTISDADLHLLWNKIELLGYFTQLKKDIEPEENTIVQVLQDPVVLTPQGKSLLLGINDWNPADLYSVMAQFGFVMADLSDLANFRKVNDAMSLIIATGFPAASIISWSTVIPDALITEDIKTQIENKTGTTDWMSTMQSVNDVLRNKQRDALVNYILYHHPPTTEVNTADKLYEYFLIDVEMDACMQTSRIRMALSSVQLFINRCLMNLEPLISPLSIRAQQWVWMRRYRVWEANRKVFLYPENWLEPELRDNKSSFFKELEGELLAADITDDLAESAFLNYLKKLDDVAKLEIAGMYLQENEQGNQDDDILHVFGRTNGHTRQYYYRRYEYGYWTPWEKISLTIEGDLIFPIVWKNQLFLFWLNIMEKAADGNRATVLKDVSTSPWGNNALKSVEINMVWGEYYKGKWSSPKSTDLKKPIVLKNLSSFNSRNVTLCAKKVKRANASERLLFNLYYLDLNKNFLVTFTSKNSAPLIQEDAIDADLYNSVRYFNFELFKPSNGNPVFVSNGNSLDFAAKDFYIGVDQPANAPKPAVTEKILTKTAELLNEYRVLPTRHPVENQWDAPFFYADEQCIFFVKPNEQVLPVFSRYDGYYDIGKIDIQPVEIQPILEKPIAGYPPRQERVDPVFDPFNIDNVNANSNYRNVLPGTSNFTFGTAVFGPSGNISGSINLQGQFNAFHS